MEKHTAKIGGLTITHLVTQEKLIKDISRKEDINIAIVRQVFESAENILFDYLSSTSPTDSYNIKLLRGLSVQSSYLPPRVLNKGLFVDYLCNEKIDVSPNITKHYIQKINKQ